jgi:hypothetical protein
VRVVKWGGIADWSRFSQCLAVAYVIDSLADA